MKIHVKSAKNLIVLLREYPQATVVAGITDPGQDLWVVTIGNDDPPTIDKRFVADLVVDSKE